MFKEHILKATDYKGGKPRPNFAAREIIKLSSNENQFGPSPKAVQAIRDHLQVLHEYPDPDATKLRIALEAHYDKRLLHEQFFCAPSGSEVIEIICRGFLETSDEVIICSPTFTPFKVFSEKIGAKVVDVPLQGEYFFLDVAKVLRAITQKTRLIFLASPNNPVGNYIPRRQLEMLINGLPEHVVLVLDEVYHHFVDADDYCTARDFVAEGYKVIGLNSFSKVYGLAGLRLGFGYTTSEIARYLRVLCKPFLLGTLSIQAGMAALTDHTFVQRSVDNNFQEKKYLYRAFKQMHLKYWPTQANFILVKPDVDTSIFEEKMLQHGIMVRPADSFRAPGCVRITIGRPDQNRKLIEALQKVVRNTNLNGSRHVA